ncbi:hypothetical protein NDU88_000607 [Pleurodeles waltl]|uniref:Uncharacterized protein n=1 Tax=Pleurodeles waltl TaxID=8319 RepID=A0AAV7USC4_PLEWA|nr:hypothetical protein NDU88_000607 [Pleurodeles waltl]
MRVREQGAVGLAAFLRPGGEAAAMPDNIQQPSPPEEGKRGRSGAASCALLDRDKGSRRFCSPGGQTETPQCVHTKPEAPPVAQKANTGSGWLMAVLRHPCRERVLAVFTPPAPEDPLTPCAIHPRTPQCPQLCPRRAEVPLPVAETLSPT